MRGPIQRNTVSLNRTGHLWPVLFSETVFLWIGPPFRRIGPHVSQDRTFSKTNAPILKKHPVFFATKLLMSAGRNAEAMEPNAYHKAEDLNNDNDASLYGHSDSFEVELEIDVLQDANAMKEHKVDIKLSTINGTETNTVKRVLSWKSIRWYHVGQSGTESSSADAEHCCKHIEKSFCGIELRRDHWLVALQSISYSKSWTLPVTSS